MCVCVNNFEYAMSNGSLVINRISVNSLPANHKFGGKVHGRPQRQIRLSNIRYTMAFSLHHETPMDLDRTPNRTLHIWYITCPPVVNHLRFTAPRVLSCGTCPHLLHGICGSTLQSVSRQSPNE